MIGIAPCLNQGDDGNGELKQTDAGCYAVLRMQGNHSFEQLVKIAEENPAMTTDEQKNLARMGGKEARGHHGEPPSGALGSGHE